MTREQQLREYAEQVVGPNPKPFTAEQQQLLVTVFGPRLQAKAQPAAKRARKRAEAA